MFCKTCGQEIPENSEFCPSCGAKIFEAAPVQTAIAPEYNESADRRYGLVKSILANAIPLAAFIIFIASIVSLAPGFIVFTTFLGLAAGIVGIVFSAQSIGAFKKMSNEGRAKPIATLILGIVGLVQSILWTAVFFFYGLIVTVLLSLL